MFDYYEPEVRQLASIIEEAVYKMNRALPITQQVAFISASCESAAQGILNELERQSVFTVLPHGTSPLRRTYFPYAFDIESAIYAGMARENQGWLCEEHPEFAGMLVDELVAQGMYLPGE